MMRCLLACIAAESGHELVFPTFSGYLHSFLSSSSALGVMIYVVVFLKRFFLHDFPSFLDVYSDDAKTTLREGWSM